MAAFIKHFYLRTPRLTFTQATAALNHNFGFLLTSHSLAWQMQSDTRSPQIPRQAEEDQNKAIAGMSPVLLIQQDTKDVGACLPACKNTMDEEGAWNSPN